MWRRSKCERLGHDWFPGEGRREFIPVTNVCLRGGCDEEQVLLPFGTCLGKHPLSDHYDGHGRPAPVEGCPAPL